MKEPQKLQRYDKKTNFQSNLKETFSPGEGNDSSVRVILNVLESILNTMRSFEVKSLFWRCHQISCLADSFEANVGSERSGAAGET